MNLLKDAPLWAQALLVALLLGAAAQDIAQRRISNWLCLAVVATAAVAAVERGPTLALWENVSLLALLLAVGLPLFASGWLGGGDVKLIAALGIWANFAAILSLLACILIAGGVLAVASLAVRGGRAARHAKGLPYGVAIAVGAAVVMLKPVLLEAKPANPYDLKAARTLAAPR